MAVHLEQLLDHTAHQVVVVDDQDGELADARRIHQRCEFGRLGLIGQSAHGHGRWLAKPGYGKPNPAEVRLLPMEFRVGDRLVEPTGEWEIAARPYTTNAGKTAHVRVRWLGPGFDGRA